MNGPRQRPPLYQAALPWVIIAVGIIIGVQAVRPPPPITSDSTEGFSADRAMEHVRTIATEPHPMGTPAIAEVREYIVEVLEDLGAVIELQSVTAPDYYGTTRPVEVVNVIARIPGTANTGTVAMVAHYDTHPATPGANDNTVAVAALLETARVVVAEPRLQNDLLFILTDSEEPAPRYGATAFVADYAAFDDIEFVLNLEAAGNSGASVLAEINGPERWLINELQSIDSRPAAFSALTATTRLLGDIGTDFDEFRDAGVAGMHFTYLHGSPIYHTENDTIDSVDPGSLQHHGAHATGIARHFGELDFSVLRDGGRSVYFPVRPFFIAYSSWMALVLALFAVAGLVLGLLAGPEEPDWPPALADAAKVATVSLGSVVVGTVVWVLVAGARPTLGGTEGYLYFGILIVAATAAIGWSGRSTRPRPGVGTLLPWIVMTVVTAFVGTGFSYLFVWPAIAAAAALFWPDGRTIHRFLSFALISLVTLIVTTPVIDILLQFSYPRPGNPDSNIPAAVIVPLGLAVLVARLLRGFWPTAAPEPPPG